MRERKRNSMSIGLMFAIHYQFIKNSIRRSNESIHNYQYTGKMHIKLHTYAMIGTRGHFVKRKRKIEITHNNIIALIL